MQINVTPGQFRKLLILTHLGEWVVNAFRDEVDRGFEQAASAVYAGAKEAGAGHWIEFDADEKAYYPSADLDEAAHRFLDEYDDQTFWDELAERLAWRDLCSRYGETAVDAMREEDRVKALDEIAVRYQKEFEARGVDRLIMPAR